MGKTSIEWTDATWNPTRGCSRVSPGCVNCYAERLAARFNSAGTRDTPPGPFHLFAERTKGGPRWTGKVELIESKIEEPRRWRKPRRVFVDSMSDLFHWALPDEAIERVFAVMAQCPQHTFQVLTKRPARMRGWIRRVHDASRQLILRWSVLEETWPLPNVRLGVSIEDQPRADERFPYISELGEVGWNTMVSIEPLLGPVQIPARYLALGNRAWVIVGGESGPGARPCDLAWIRSPIAQCRAAVVACFVKQVGAAPEIAQSCGDCDRCMYGQPCMLAYNVALELRNCKGGDPAEWPEDLRVREFPEAR